jgi:hypothetical protein
MNFSSNHGFVNQLLVYTLVMIGFSGSIGLGTVWMRHQISVTANSNKQLDARIAMVERHLAETITAAESERDTRVLLRRNAEWNLGLVAPTHGQIVRLGEDPVMRLAAKRNAGLFGDTAPQTAAVYLPLARR